MVRNIKLISLAYEDSPEREIYLNIDSIDLIREVISQAKKPIIMIEILIGGYTETVFTLPDIYEKLTELYISIEPDISIMDSEITAFQEQQLNSCCDYTNGRYEG